jgi:sec-independent protein translocase protein TatA
MSSLGFPELLLILGIAFLVFIVFGPKNLPKLGKMFGSTMSEVRKGMNEFNEEASAAKEDDSNIVVNPCAAELEAQLAAAREREAAETAEAPTVIEDLSVEQLEAMLEAKKADV